MNVNTPTGFGNRRDRNGSMNIIFSATGQSGVSFGSANDGSVVFNLAGQSTREINRALRENQNRNLFEAHDEIRQRQQDEQRRRSRRRRTGAARLSNTDSISRAHQIRARLLAKIQEIAASEMDQRSRDRMITDIQMQIDRVDRQIAAIKRREQAMQEERMNRDDSPEARRRRQRDMQERRIYIRRELLYHANKGGFDPNDPLFRGASSTAPIASMSFDFGKSSGTIDTAGAGAGIDVGAGVEAAAMEVVM